MMLRLTVDLRSKMPLYLQLVEQIRRLIAAGELPAGTQLPTVRQLAADLRINFNTVARAYRVLDEAGLITTRQGRGTYVLEAKAENGERWRRIALGELLRTVVAEAARLGFGLEDVASEMERTLAAWPTTSGRGTDTPTASAQSQQVKS